MTDWGEKIGAQCCICCLRGLDKNQSLPPPSPLSVPAKNTSFSGLRVASFDLRATPGPVRQQWRQSSWRGAPVVGGAACGWAAAAGMNEQPSAERSALSVEQGPGSLPYSTPHTVHKTCLFTLLTSIWGTAWHWVWLRTCLNPIPWFNRQQIVMTAPKSERADNCCIFVLRDIALWYYIAISRNINIQQCVLWIATTYIVSQNKSLDWFKYGTKYCNGALNMGNRLSHIFVLQ